MKRSFYDGFGDFQSPQKDSSTMADNKAKVDNVTQHNHSMGTELAHQITDLEVTPNFNATQNGTQEKGRQI